MDKNEFRNMVEKYKNELIKMAGLNVNAMNTAVAASQNQPAENTQNESQNLNSNAEYENNNSQQSQTRPFEQGAPYTGMASGDNSENETYQEFLDKNKEQGYLKVQAFTAQQAFPISGVNVIISKKFSDGEKVFFEGSTDESGIIDNIELPTPSRLLSEQPEDVLPYADYDFSSSHSQYITENASKIQIFEGIKSIQPIRVIV